ncbi:MAG: decaprenylphospho-beta-D-erythro-pentofuranosid-2-ulose 2-reductase [Actinomycetota bacterium]|nr:decaprenylphospho-beta-D-erythro-pentofuranosid-2-ulose 2-reductase [Actinomycetota bacterium]
MIDSTGNPQRVLLLGGSSEIGLATVRELVRHAPRCHVVLAGRPGERRTVAAEGLRQTGLEVAEVDFDATDRTTYEPALAAAFGSGDVDVAVVAFGILGDQERAWQEVDVAVQLAEVNFLAPVAVGVLLAQRMRIQGHGSIVVLSSVAGERPRRSNFVYGSTKAGVDAFFQGLGEAVRADGVDVLVVRPGFVRSKLTAGLDAAPLAQTPEQVAVVTVASIRARRLVAWAPTPLRWVMVALRHLPTVVFRRLPI